MIENPILKGFNPDPSILRVGSDYYIATSTFEWFPGIQIHNSKDLKHWKLLTHALDRKEQLDLRGLAPSKGVWAPCLSYDGEWFYLAYSLVKSIANNFFDVENYLVTARSIMGPWSDPIFLNCSGFDPSMFHDDDGRKWILSLEWDFREGYEHPGPIILQEYSATMKKLIGKPRRIYRGGTDRGCLEGPHLYKRNGYYYIMAAEGGTGYGHSVTMARSNDIFGPYESDPYNPIITSWPEHFNERGNPNPFKPHYFNPNSYLQKSGHGSLTETQDGEWYIAHLCSRPILPELRSVLGRETAIQKCKWTEDGWLRLNSGGRLAEQYTEESKAKEHIFEQEQSKDDFENEKLNVNFSTLRIPFDESWGSLSERKGYLRLKGKDSLFSVFDQSLVARRIQSFNFTAETCVEFEPENYQQSAGLVCFYDNMNHYYLRIYYNESLKSKCIAVSSSDNGKRSDHLEYLNAIDNDRAVYMRVNVNVRKMQFFFSLDGEDWTEIGPVFDASKLSDEYCKYGEFTGAFVGICCQDMSNRTIYADFDYFKYL